MELNSIIIIIAALAIILVVLLVNHKRKALPSVDHNELVKLQTLLDEANKNKAELKTHYELMLQDERDRARSDKEEALRAKDAQFERVRAEDDARHKRELDLLKEHFEKTMAEMQTHVKAATEDILQERQREFSETNTKDMGNIVKPLTDIIAQMRETMQQTSKEQNSLTAVLKEKADLMVRQSEAAKKSAEELTEAFKNKSKVQGDWGEEVLERMLVDQGLQRGRDYEVQYVLRDNDNHVLHSDNDDLMRPDLVLHLDNDRDVIIDAKVSMTAYLEYVNADRNNDKEAKEYYLKKHIESIKSHIDELAAKEYYKYHAKSMIDFVIMFVPNMDSLRLAMAEQPTLWYEAMGKRVFIADGQMLYASLQIIKRTWVQIDQEEKFVKLMEYAEELRDRVGDFLGEYKAIGDALQRANQAFLKGDAKLAPSGKSISTTIDKIMKTFSLPNRKGKRTKSSAKTVPAIPDKYIPLPLDTDAETDLDAAVDVDASASNGSQELQ